MKHWEKYVKKVKCQNCGSLFNAYTYNIKKGWGRYGEIVSPLIEWYKKKPRFGKNSPNWRGGKTRIGRALRMSFEYKE